MECKELYLERRVGNTTRQVDFAVQKLYERYVVLLEDHHGRGGNARSNTRLSELLLRRLEREHTHLLDNRIIKIDKKSNMFDYKRCHTITIEDGESNTSNSRLPIL